MMRRIDIFAVILLSLTLSGCRLRRPDNVLSPRKMEQFLYDYHLAQAIGQELPKEEKYTTQAYIDWAYRKHGITKEEFNTSLVWYTRYPNEFTKIYKRLSNRIDDEYKVASKSLSQIEKKAFSIQSGDSVNLWYLDRNALLNSSVFMNKLTYNLDRDTTFHLGDTLCLNLFETFVSIDSGVPAYSYVSLSAYYSDSISTSDTILRNSGDVRLYVVLDSVKNITSISGSINYVDSTDNRGSMLVLSGMELMRYHERVPVDTTHVVVSDTLSAAEF